MKAAIFKGKGKIELGDRPDPTIQEPTDAVVRVVRGCVCGSDLWYYRGINPHKIGSIGHEYIGVVETVGDRVTTLSAGDFVIAPFTFSDGTCPACQAGFQSNCEHGGAFGNGDHDGGQGQYVRPVRGRDAGEGARHGLGVVPPRGRCQSTSVVIYTRSGARPRHAAIIPGMKETTGN